MQEENVPQALQSDQEILFKLLANSEMAALVFEGADGNLKADDT